MNAAWDERLEEEARGLVTAAVTLNFLTVSKARHAVKRFLSIPEGSRPSFQAWVIANRLLTPREIRLLSALPKRIVLRCPSCPQEFDVTGIPPGSRFECPRCAALVTVPALRDSALRVAPPPPDGEEPDVSAESFPEQEDLARRLAEDGYELLEKIGQGGMGAVFLAWDRKLNRRVAVKVLLSGVLATQAQVERFEREAKAVAALNHPSIVRVYTLGSHKGFHYYVMDYVEGRSLDKMLAEGPMNPVRAARLCADICDAVSHAHEAGIIHRDLKPANILIDTEGRPLVADFGLAKLEDAATTLTESGVAIGTPYYMSPEQASGDVKRITKRSDVYSLGVILYEMLCGRLPFEGKRAVDVMMKVLNEDPPLPSSFKKGIPAELEAIALKAMAREPSDRYAGADEMARDLEAFLGGMTVTARPPGPLKRVARTLKRSRYFLAAVVAALVSLGFYSLFFNTMAPKRDPAAPMLAALSDAETALEMGRFDQVAKLLEAASAVGSDERVARKASALKEKFLERLVNLFEEAEGDAGADALVPLLAYFPRTGESRKCAAKFAAATAEHLDELLSTRGPQAAGGFLSAVLAKLGPYSSALQGMVETFCHKLTELADEAEKNGDVDRALECLQTYLMFRPEDAEAARRVERLKSSREEHFFDLITRVMQKIGFGTVLIEGAHHGCKMTISSLSEEYGAPLEADLRVQTAFMLKNGFYLFRFERPGYEPLERKSAVEAEKKTVITIREEDWVKADE